jgi:plastocyanin
MYTKYIVIGIVAVAGFVGLLALGGQRATPPAQMPETTHKSDTAAPSEEETPAASVNVNIAPASTAPVMHPATIESFAFTPRTITIKKGDTIVWTNKDDASHTITSDTSGPVSKTLRGGDTYAYTFTEVGTFPYHCSFHPAMTGTVIVTE